VTSGQLAQKLGFFGEYHEKYVDPLAIVFRQLFILSVCTLHVLQDAFYNFFQFKKFCTFVAAHASMKIIRPATSNFAFYIQFPLMMAGVDRNTSEALCEKYNIVNT
jgi:hypothetical protein